MARNNAPDFDELGFWAGEIRDFMDYVNNELSEYVGSFDRPIIDIFCDYLDAWSKGIRGYDSKYLDKVEEIEEDIRKKIKEALEEE